MLDWSYILTAESFVGVGLVYIMCQLRRQERTDRRLDAIEERITTLEKLTGSGPASPSRRSSPAQPSEELPTPGPFSAAEEAVAEEGVSEAPSWGELLRRQERAYDLWLKAYQAVQDRLERDRNPSRNPPAS